MAGTEVLTGSIRSDELLSLTELRRRLGWQEHAVRQARRAGLRLVSFGREKYVLGRDVLDFFARLGAEQAAGGEQQILEGGE